MKNVNTFSIQQTNQEQVSNLQSNLNITNTLARILSARGIKNLKDAKDYLYPNLLNIHNPFLLKDLRKAVKRINKAIINKEKTLIYGDKDVDGQTSTALLKTILSSYDLDTDYYIPFEDGYGLGEKGIQFILDNNYELVITVDCGITNIDDIKFLMDKGIDVVVLDHHEPKETIPKAVAVVDPKRDDSECPFKDYSGCGVVFKFAQGLHLSHNYYFDKKLAVIDLETTGLHPKNDEIIEIGAVILENGIIKERFNSLVKPEKNKDFNTEKINGITPKMCEDAPEIQETIKEFDDFIKDVDAVIIHNANFDLPFINNVFERILNKSLDKPIIDTLKISKTYYPEISHSLESLVKKFNIKHDNPHRALSDAMAAADLFWKMLIDKDVFWKQFFKSYLDIVSLSTIADVMPLCDENRIIVKHGLGFFDETRWTGLNVLKSKILDSGEKVSSKSIAWKFSPLLNSAGRVGKPEIGVDLLLSNHKDEALLLYNNILKLNENRKSLQQKGLDSAKLYIENFVDLNKEDIIFVADDKIEKGVTGLIANKLVQEYKKPAIILSIKDNESTGSMRTIDGYNIVTIFEMCSDLLLKFGGHKKAGGVTLLTKNLDKFKDQINEVIKNIKIDSTDSVTIDIKLKSTDLEKDFFNELDLLEPFGICNESPIIYLENVRFNKIYWMGQNKNHFKGTISLKNGYSDIIGWNMLEYKDKLSDSNIDLLVTPERSFYNNQASWRLQIKQVL